MITWIKTWVNGIDESYSRMGDEGERWIKQVNRWWKRWFKMNNVVEYYMRKGHYEFHMHFLYNGQWWYISSGDVRFKVVDEMLIKKCEGPRDYSGGANRYIAYDKDFEDSLNAMVQGRLLKAGPWKGVDIVRPNW